MPRRFRKKPVEVDVWYFDPNTAGVKICDDICNWIIRNGGDADYSAKGPQDRHIHIFTLEGRMKANPGDYIIRGVAGEFYPCKPDIFEKTYEPVE